MRRCSDLTVGKDSFFKAHKDTPRSENLFGSLVIVYPTVHKGGALLLRHGGQEWSFDSAEAVRNHEGPVVAYIAFFSDVEHEVAVVESGYRVTLTYNLYFADENSRPAITAEIPGFEEALSGCLENAEFLPSGGSLGFGLSFKYDLSSDSKTGFSDLGTRLKGHDAEIKRVSERLGLKASIKAVYYDKWAQTEWEDSPSVMVNKIHDFNPSRAVADPIEALREESFGSGLVHSGEDSVVWVTPLTDWTQVVTNFLRKSRTHIGDTVGFIYGDVCLIVEVGPFGVRSRVR